MVWLPCFFNFPSLDCTEAKTVFGWEPRITLDEGIQKTINWYHANM